MGESKNEEQIKADSVQGAAAPKQISTIIQPCSLHRDSITENKASVYVSGLVWIKKIFFIFLIFFFWGRERESETLHTLPQLKPAGLWQEKNTE